MAAPRPRSSRWSAAARARAPPARRSILAAALWHQGQDVLVLDEHGGPRSASALCIDPRGRPGRGGDAARLAAPPRPAAPAASCRAGSAGPSARARRGSRGGPSAAASCWWTPPSTARAACRRWRARPTTYCVVLQPHAASITAAYAGIKRLHYGARACSSCASWSAGRRRRGGGAASAATWCAPAAATWPCRCEPAGWVRADPQPARGAAPRARAWSQAFPAGPAAADFRRIAAECWHWPVRAGAGVAAARGLKAQGRTALSRQNMYTSQGKIAQGSASPTC